MQATDGRHSESIIRDNSQSDDKLPSLASLYNITARNMNTRREALHVPVTRYNGYFNASS